MARRRKAEDPQFGNLSFMDVLANAIGAITFLFLMFFIIISGLVRPGQFKILTEELPDARGNSSYGIFLAASGGVPPYRWTVSDGRLPGGVRLDKRNGKIEGAPIAVGTYRFSVKVSDGSEGQAQRASKPLLLRVRQPAERRIADDLPLEIATGRLTAPSVGAHYDVTLSATGGEEPYRWSMVGALPPGLSLQEDRIVGVPLAAGDWPFSLRVRDAANAAYEKSFLTYVNPRTVLTEDALEPLSIKTARIPNGVFRKQYALALSASGGVPPYAWAIARGELPRGLILDPDTGVIGGEPRRQDKRSFVVSVTDSQGGRSKDEQRLILTIDPIFFGAATQNPLLTWWVLLIVGVLVVVGIALLSAFVIGVQCPWDHSWRCKSVGQDPQGRMIYACKHGHTFVNEPRLLSDAPKV